MKLEEYESAPEIEKKFYDSVEKDLQERLYILFSESSKQNTGIILLLEGWAGSGKGDLLKSITTRLDPRKLRVYSFQDNSLKDSDFHFMYEFWCRLPSYNEQAIFDGSWYSKLALQIQEKIIKKKEYNIHYDFIKNFEETLLADKYILLKFFLNISAKEQKKRFKKATEEGKKWIVSEDDWNQYNNYYTYKELFEEYLYKTNSNSAPWHILSAGNKYYTKIKTMELIINELEQKLKIDSREMLSILKNKEEQTI
jgi:polyphosphate kinase 2 (PPK2 family)